MPIEIIMMKLYNILKYFIATIILVSLIANVVVSLNERDFDGLFSLRNLFLIVFLICFIFNKKWSLVLLIMINISYWYFYFTANSNLAYYNHPVVDYTHTINDLFGETSKIVKGIILILPLLTNLLVSVIIIPFRLMKLKNEIAK